MKKGSISAAFSLIYQQLATNLAYHREIGRETTAVL